MKKTTCFRMSLMILLSAVLFTACSKSSGSENNSSYYMTATIDGKDWSANLSNNSFKSPALAGIGSSNGVEFILVLGIRVADKDSSAFALVFPKTVSLNQTLAFDASKYMEGAYIDEVSPGSTLYNGYNTTPATGGSGSFSVTTFDETNKILEGSFSGTFGSTTGAAGIKVVNGKFRCPYTTDINSVKNMSGLKF